MQIGIRSAPCQEFVGTTLTGGADPKLCKGLLGDPPSSLQMARRLGSLLPPEKPVKISILEIVSLAMGIQVMAIMGPPVLHSLPRTLSLLKFCPSQRFELARAGVTSKTKIVRNTNTPVVERFTEIFLFSLVFGCWCCSGMKWKEQGARMVLSLRALVLTQTRWNQFWEKIDQYGFPLAA
jgi:hypothetical protein